MPTAAGDLVSRADVHDLVVAFYREVVFDPVLEPVFHDVAEVDWADHIPRLIDYWCRIVLGEPGFTGNVVAAHRHLHEQSPLRADHFDRWLALWEQTVDEGWSGPHAERAKAHARRVAGSLATRLLGHVHPLGSAAQAPSSTS